MQQGGNLKAREDDLMPKAEKISPTNEGDEFPEINVSQQARLGSAVLKRCFDIAISALGILVLLPLFLVLYLLVRSANGTPVFFTQLRPGRDGKLFVLYKIRTMVDLTDQHGEPLPDEKRLTGLGKFLRATSFDELPELFNVLKGDMSLVGPRPLLMEYLPLYSAEQARRHEVRPGITGWAQINGRNLLSWEEKFELDVWYVDNWNLLLDLKIIGLTFLKVFKGEGVSAEAHATMPKFTKSKALKD